MKNTKINADTILPFGETLRPLIVSSYLTKADLKQTLARRGIFTCSSEKEVTIPILVTLLMSPKEYDSLREKQRTKEDNVKMSTQSIPLSQDIQLVEAISNITINAREMVNNGAVNYKVEGAPQFIINSNDVLELDFKITRNDITKDWANAESTHEGKVKVAKDKTGNLLEITMEYTSTETKDLNNKIVRTLVKQFKENGYINNKSELAKITFKDFSNENRIQFFFSICDDPLNIMEFKHFSNVEIGPDPAVVLPSRIDWMQNKVRNLILKGENLHDMSLLREKEYRECLILESIEAVFRFSYSGGQGTCAVEYGFSGYLNTPNPQTEFEMKITNLKLDPAYTHVSKTEITKKLLSMFDAIKAKKYPMFKTH